MKFPLLTLHLSSLFGVVVIGLFVMGASPLYAQRKISGFWEGTITQDVAVYKSSYKFEMLIKQKGTKVTGRSYVYADNQFAIMEFEGEFKNNLLAFKELKIIDYKELLDMEWCIKNGMLSLKENGAQLQLEGGWSGKSSQGTCNPGRIVLKKAKSRV